MTMPKFGGEILQFLKRLVFARFAGLIGIVPAYAAMTMRMKDNVTSRRIS